MIIKTFRAESSAAALKIVREEMGGDAVVLKTTEILSPNNTLLFEVTACLENPTVDQSNKIFADQEEFVTDNSIPTVIDKIEQEEVSIPINRLHDDKKLKNRNHPFESLFVSLVEHDFDREFINEFINELQESYTQDTDPTQFAETKLVSKFSSYFSHQFSFNMADRIALVGPAGSGKSSVMGKIATQLVVKEKQKIMLVTLDDVKMGAFDETCAYAEILGTEYADSRTSAETIQQNKGMVTLIDTMAIPIQKENVLPISEKLDAIETTERLAVFSATMRSKDIKAFTEQMHAIKATKIIVTMTDLTECIGSIITAAYQTGLPIIFTTDNQGGIGKLHTPDPAQLARQILNIEVICE